MAQQNPKKGKAVLILSTHPHIFEKLHPNQKSDQRERAVLMLC